MVNSRSIAGLVRNSVMAAIVSAAAVAPAGAQATAPGPYFPPPSWDLTLPANGRFLVLSNFNSQAVLDFETGLVWERTAGDVNNDGVVNFDDRRNWLGARGACANKSTGGRKGWRLASFDELTSLVDPSVTPGAGPVLPAGHPFIGVQVSQPYWSATETAGLSSVAWIAVFFDGSATFMDTGNNNFVWCVRGGGRADRY